MALINSEVVTLLDIAKRTGPDGLIANVVEALTKENALLKDATWREGNLPTGHRVSARTGLPSVYWRRFNEGIAPSKSRVDNYDESIGMLEGMSVVDCEEANLNGNEAAFRASEDMSFMSSMNNEAESSFLYGSALTKPEQPNGIIPRYNSLTTGYGPSQVIDASRVSGVSTATGTDQSSILLVNWHPKTVYGIYPKGSTAGITPHDMGEQLWTDANQRRYRAYVTNWVWKMGWVVEDARSIVRIANIDQSAFASTNRNIIESMVRAFHMLRGPAGKKVFYVNQQVASFLHLQALNGTTNSTVTIQDIGGQPVTMFLGCAVRTTDSLVTNESVVV